jgi:hypothetical protein
LLVLVGDREVDLIVVGDYFGSDVFRFLLEVWVFGGHAQKAVKEINCIFKVTDFLSGTCFADESLFFSVAEVVAGFSV